MKVPYLFLLILKSRSNWFESSRWQLRKHFPILIVRKDEINGKLQEF